MKIALVILHADPARGGAERYTVELAGALRERGHRVSVVASSFDSSVHSRDDVYLPTESGTRSSKYLRFLDQLDDHTTGTEYDVVHAMLPVRRCNVYHPHAGIAAEAVDSGHLKHSDLVSQALSRVATQLNRRRQLFSAVERALLNMPRPPVVLCLSDYIRRSVRKYYELDPALLVRLFNAVDLARFDRDARPGVGLKIRERFAIDPSRTVALLIANDFERKGVREAILAKARVRNARLVLLIVGKEDPRSYQNLARREKAGGVIFAGATDDVYAFYQAADFFVLPTRHDPCSLVVLEALAMKLPVISTIFNGACEIMTDGKHGVILPEPGELVNLTDAMREMLEPARRAAMQAACEQLRPKLAYGRHLDELIAVYEGEVARGK